MGNFIKKALASVGKNIVIFVVSILTILFLVLADIVALVIYPFWAWRNPLEASNCYSLVEVIGWSWMVDIVNPENRGCNSALVRFFQTILRPIDAAVVKFWNAMFMKFAPMKKRKYFIDTLGNHLQSLSEKTQNKYFWAVSFDRKVYLIKNNMLSPEVLPGLYPYCVDAFIEAGKLTDQQFNELASSSKIERFCSKYDINLQKQRFLIEYVFKAPQHFGSILRSYIMRKGLHPSAVSYFYELLSSSEDKREDIVAIPKVLQYRQDLVTVNQTNAEHNRVGTGEVFAKYLKQIGRELGYDAQVAMSAWQYEVFHKLGFPLLPRAIRTKLSCVNKTEDATIFVKLLMKYYEFEGDEVAMAQIAADEKLSSLWLQHLSEKEKTAEK